MGTKTSRLEELRLDFGLNKADFADLMGVSKNYYYNILKGDGSSNLRLEHLENLLTKKGVNPAWIMTGQGNKYLLENIGVKPKVTATILKAVISEGFPKGWEKTWTRKVLDSLCEKVVSTNDNLSLIEMQNAVLRSMLIVIAQVDELIAASSNPGDTITLNLEEDTFVFRRNKDGLE